jgi:hypothetical protein
MERLAENYAGRALNPLMWYYKLVSYSWVKCNPRSMCVSRAGGVPELSGRAFERLWFAEPSCLRHDIPMLYGANKQYRRSHK